MNAGPVSGYTLPVGVPDPGWGLNEIAPSAPSPWTSEKKGYYYVNYTAGTDAGRTYGTPTAPRKTIPSPVPPGSRVELHGTYSSPTTLLTGAGTGATWSAGTAGPAWIVGDGVTKPLIGSKYFIKGSYLYIDGIGNVPGNTIQIGSLSSAYAADHIMIRNSEIAGTLSTSGGISAYGNATSPLTQIIIYNCSVHTFGSLAALVDEDHIVGTLDAYVSYGWVLHNTFYDCSAGFRVGSANPTAGPTNTHHVFVADNEVYGILQSGLWVKYAKDIVFSSNYVHDIVDTSWSPAKCIGAQYEPDGLWMIFNRLTNARYGIYIAGTDDTGGNWPIYAIGNVIYNIHHISGDYSSKGGYGEAGIMTSGSKERYVINNTLHNVDSGYNAPSGGTETHIINNIVSNITEANGYHLAIGSTTGTIEYSNNLLFDDTGDRILWNTKIYNLKGLQAATGKGAGCVVGDPLFTDAAAGNFTVQAGSPAIDAGSSTLIDSLVSSYRSAFGVDIGKDFAGNVRPQGKAWDIGAFEFVGGKDTGGPSAPKNLTIVP